jgi:LmbE family N-acetylglucosaminyl deacetylase
MMKKIYKRLKAILLKQMCGIPSKSKYKFIIKDWINLTDINACSRVLETKRFFRNIQPIEIDFPSAARILVISPHPDDDILGAGGTLMKAIDNGAEVHVVYVTNGNDNHRKDGLIKRETLKVCKSIGMSPHFLGCHKKKIPLFDNSVNNKLFSLIKEIKPEAIFITFLLDDHDDHRRINHLLLKILENQKFPETEIWAYQIYSTVIPNVVINITKQADKKRELLHIWQSVSGNRDWAHYMLGINAANCRYIPSKDPIYVEAYFVLPIKEYLELCRLYFNREPSKIYYEDCYRSNL